MPRNHAESAEFRGMIQCGERGIPSGQQKNPLVTAVHVVSASIRSIRVDPRPIVDAGRCETIESATTKPTADPLVWLRVTALAWFHRSTVSLKCPSLGQPSSKPY